MLVTAPTGSGKTLTAFLWAINQLLTGRLPLGVTSVLYISPLKALNNDIYRNLLFPLQRLRFKGEACGGDRSFLDIRVQTRSGDTPQSERRKMLRNPPEILITTPESLNLLLSSAGGRTILTNLSTVILDEIHAVFDNKRGTHLITAVERLVRFSGEFQRIALSATVRPLETVAEFIGGYSLSGSASDPRYTPRKVSIVQSTSEKKYDIKIAVPDADAGKEKFEEDFWKPLVGEFKRILQRNNSTLFFVNNRKLAEKITLKINYDEPSPIAYAHHGSLSREIRSEVERKLKSGDLKAIIATNSLELGIDIGALDEVVLIQSPPSLSSAIQRVGRAGHRVGEISRGTIFPTHDFDFLEAALLASGIVSQALEPLSPIVQPLDVLAQIIISMVGVEAWDIDELFAAIRASYPYNELPKGHFDLVINMLAGRYADARIRELKPRVSIDRIDNTIVAKKGALLTLYLSGGMIPDRGYYHLRHQDSGALIGDLDEEFVWEARIGQSFTFGTQQWKIQRITHNDVFVVPGSPSSMATPFWKGEGFNRDFFYSQMVSTFLEEVNDRLNDPGLSEELQKEYCMERAAADRLLAFLKKQRDDTGTDLPHRHHLLLEFVGSGPGGGPGNQLVLHTMWGGRVNRPFAMVLEAAWQREYGEALEVYAGNDCIVLQLPHEIGAEELLSMVSGANVEELLRERLESSGFFGARFRENAGRALLVTRNKVTERMPLWMSRLKSQKLLKSVQKYSDFPILLESWRTCLQDEFDVDSLRLVLDELASGLIHYSETRTHFPSPLAQNLSWKQINQYMYRGDEAVSNEPSKLRTDLLSEIVFSPGLRPTVSRDIVLRFEKKKQRLFPGYAPSSAAELLDWLKERLVIPGDEWEKLVEQMRTDYPESAEEWLAGVAPKITELFPAAGKTPLKIALEHNDAVRGALKDDDTRLFWLLEQWLRFYGPLSVDFIRGRLDVEESRLVHALEDLAESGVIITGQLISDGAKDDLCDAENFEVLLRIARAAAVPEFDPLPIERLPLFLAAYQGLTDPGEGIDDLYRSIEQLLCYRASAGMWEAEYLPARMVAYSPSWLDAILQEGELRWAGSGEGAVLFSFPSDADLLEESSDTLESIKDLFPDEGAKYDFSALLKSSNLSVQELSETLWGAVWHGQVGNDTFQSLRKGIQTQFKIPEVPRGQPSRRSRISSRSRFATWKSSLPYAGNWYLRSPSFMPEDLLDTEERKKERVRILLDRYGVLFRELLLRELPAFRWSGLFRTLRIMELSGEILAGYFFRDVPGPQFISHRALRRLKRKLPEETVFWLNATDPASPCGLQLEALRGMLPKRLEGTHIVYRGGEIVLISEKKGEKLTIRVAPDDPEIQQLYAPLHHLLFREFAPQRRLTVATINEKPAVSSPYLESLKTGFDVVVDPHSVTLYRAR